MAEKKKAVKPKVNKGDTTLVKRMLTDIKARHIELLPTDFGREDLNLMAAKINEIIEKR